MTKPDSTKIATRRMSPALAAYLKRTVEPKPGSKIMSLLRQK